MAFSRNSLAAAVAGTLSLAVLTGCPAQPPTTPTPSATTPGGTAPTAAPGTTDPNASPAAPVSAAPGATTPPNANASPTPLVPTTLRGKVYDEDGATAGAGTQVTVKSLNPSNPFDSTVDVISGNYVVNNVPAGVQLEVTAKRTGWTSRTRVETLLPLTSTQPNIVNFGAANYSATTQEDPEGVAYFISERPEITSVTPADDAENVDPTKLVVTLTLSEPLNTTNQRRFADAIRVVPANAAATGDDESGLTPLEQMASGSFADTERPYFIEEGVTFLGEEATRASVTWDAAGQVATLTFNAPLIASDSDEADYQILLVRGSDDIEDADGNELGDAEGAGQILTNTFREEDLALGNLDSEFEGNVWAATHQSTTTFSVAEDDTDPQLTGVSVTEVGQETRINLTFSEPMAAFNGDATGYFDQSLLVAANYSFAIAEEQGDLADVDLEGDAGVDTAQADVINNGADTEPTDGVSREEEFNIVGNGGQTTYGTEAAQGTGVYVEINPTDAKTVRLVIENNQFFADDVNAIKVRVEGVADPAGNVITDSQADAQIKTGTI